MKPAHVDVSILRVSHQQVVTQDTIAVEEPLEIRIVHGPRSERRQFPLGITMRTPGHDEELAAGLALAEGIISDCDDLEGVHLCGTSETHNVVMVELIPQRTLDPEAFRRNTLVTSACGICGRRAVDELRERLGPRQMQSTCIDPAIIKILPDRVRIAQTVFARTGGLHAAGLFDHEGHLLSLREDVGRHNAVDKLIGHQLGQEELPLSGKIIFVSGRASYELTQKAIVAGASVLAAVGAPSSLAIDLARKFGLILLGFVRDGRFNQYSPAPATSDQR